MHGVEDYAALMASLRLPDPKMIDVPVPANMRQGLQEEVARLGLFDGRSEGSCREEGCADRSAREGRARSGRHHPGFGARPLRQDDGGLIHELAMTGKMIVFYCAFGERSAMAVQAAPDWPPPQTLRAAWRRG